MPTPIPTATVMPPSPPTPIATAMPSPTSTSGPTLTPTAILPTPALPPSVLNNFFLGGNGPECQLPCWNGLVIGESDQGDVEAVFDNILGFDGAYDFVWESSIIEGFDYIDYVWDSDNGWLLDVFFWVEEDTYTLRGMEFGWIGGSYLGSQMSLRSILRELGSPPLLLVMLVPAPAYSASYDVVAVYEEQGIAFWLSDGLLTDTATGPDGSEEISTEVCLGRPFSIGSLYIVEPLENGLHNMSSLQEPLLDFIPDNRYLDPSEEVLGLTAEEVTALAMQDEDVCITIQLEP